MNLSSPSIKYKNIHFNLIMPLELRQFLLLKETISESKNNELRNNFLKCLFYVELDNSKRKHHFRNYFNSCSHSNLNERI